MAFASWTSTVEEPGVGVSRPRAVQSSVGSPPFGETGAGVWEGQTNPRTTSTHLPRPNQLPPQLTALARPGAVPTPTHLLQAKQPVLGPGQLSACATPHSGVADLGKQTARQ